MRLKDTGWILLGSPQYVVWTLEPVSRRGGALCSSLELPPVRGNELGEAHFHPPSLLSPSEFSPLDKRVGVAGGGLLPCAFGLVNKS